MPSRPTPRLIALAATLAALQAGSAFAQTTPAQPAGDGLKLDSIVITGASSARSKMRSSVAVSTIETDGVVAQTANSAADVLRSVPGLRAESSGGESNANIGVRGLPISAGGARYIQFQEDGLPVLQFGDIAFATADTWLRVDSMLDRLEVVRGGSASTLATGAPGGIINYVSKTGLEAGGSAQLSQGLGYSQTRVDLGYGGRAMPGVRYYVGGFYRVGDGGRPGADNTEGGGQLRGNVTFELGGKSYVRLSGKLLDDRTPTFMPTPVRFVGGEIQQIAGLDPRKAAFYNANWPADNTLTNSNGRTTSKIQDGLTAKSTAFGVDADIDLGSGLRVQNKFSYSKNSGRFIGVFPGDDVSLAPAGTTLVDGGAAYAGNKFTAVIFNTKVDDVGLLANDAKLTKEFDLGGGAKVGAVAGLYLSQQQLKLTWNFNQYSITADESGARLLNVPGTVNGSPGFGGCCMNFQDSKYTTTAPYVILNYESGAFTGDASVRQDSNKATGSYFQTLPDFGGTTAGVAYNLAAPRKIDYSFNKTSYSVGGNYALSRDLSLFGRVSEGAAYNADRITFFNAPGLVNGTSPEIPVNKVRQIEGGVKVRQGAMSLFATVFAAKTDEINVDVTTSPIRSTSTKYDSKGLELEGAARFGMFSVLAGATFTDAKVSASSNAALVGRAPKRQARLVYQLTPTVQFNDAITAGVNIVGTTGSQDDGPAGPLSITLPAYTVVNLFASYSINDRMTVGLAANNLFDTLAYTESNDGRGAARAHTGRTVKASLKYAF